MNKFILVLLLAALPSCGQIGTSAGTTAAQSSTSIAAFGGVDDGLTDNYAAFTAALATGKCIRVPKTSTGIYRIANTTSATYSGFSGGGIYVNNLPVCMVFDAGASLAFDSYANDGIVVHGSPSVNLSGFQAYYATVRATCDPSLWSATTTTNCIGFRNNARALDIETSSNVVIDKAYIHDAPSASLTIGGSSNVFVSNSFMQRGWANGFFIVDVQHGKFSNNSTQDVQDAGLELSQYTIGGPCADITINGYSSQGWGGFLNNGCTQVTVDGMNLVNGGGMSFRQDPATTHTSWPYDTSVSNVTITNVGASYYLNRINSPAIEFVAMGDTPPSPVNVSLSNVTVNGNGLSGKDLLVDSTYTGSTVTNQWAIKIDGMRGLNSSHCADFRGSSISISRASCEYPIAGGEGYIVRGTQQFSIRNSSVTGAASGVPTLLVTSENTTGAFIDGFHVNASTSSDSQVFTYGGSGGTGIIRDLIFTGLTNVTPSFNGNALSYDYTLPDGTRYTKVAGVGSVPNANFGFFAPTTTTANNKAVCVKNGGAQLGVCSTQPDSNGNCTCN